MSKILIIEDDKVISDGLKQLFTIEGYQVSCAYDGESGLYAAQTESPDLVILDIMMPHLNGFEVTTELRRGGDHVPIIVVSARSHKTDKIKGLDLGADDYITKPFDLEELLARVRRLLKKQNETAFEFGDFVYSFQNQLLTQKGSNQSVPLLTKERQCLEFFLKRKNQIVSREQILNQVWGSDYEGSDRTVDNVIVTIRKKIGSRFLLTERGSGYRFVTNP